MSQLTLEDAEASKFQIGILMRGQNIKYRPYAAAAKPTPIHSVNPLDIFNCLAPPKGLAKPMGLLYFIRHQCNAKGQPDSGRGRRLQDA